MEAKEGISSNNKYNQIISLFDLCWFHHLILFSLPPLPQLAQQDIIKPSPLPQQLPRHRRTRSNDTNPSFLSPPFRPPRLQTIISGKETLHPIPTNQTAQSRTMNTEYERERHLATHTQLQSLSTKEKMRKHKRHCKSMSELELEELKGLMDLGFSFSDIEGSDSRLTSIVPGLRRRDGEGDVEIVRRPYLSEAWAVRDEPERMKLLRDWRVLKNGDEHDVKEHLRRWAHAVASTVN